MLDTVLDFEVYNDFISNQPNGIIGKESDCDFFNSFWQFLKKGTNLTINITEVNPNIIFLNELTSGRGNTTFNINNHFHKPKKNTFPRKTKASTIFFLSETEKDEQKKYMQNNGFIFGFIDNYRKIWESISLLNKDKVKSIRKSSNITSWDFIEDYTLPFSDLLIIDNYIFETTLKFSNLYVLIKKYSKSTSIKFNLLIISYIGNNNEIIIENEYEELRTFIEKNNIKCNLNIILSNKEFKEHDRTIITNYFRVKSGDSFNYFKSNGDLATKGTEIEFHSLIEEDKYYALESLISDLNLLITNIKSKDNHHILIKYDGKNGLINTI